jgi:hypothetical protein
MTQLSQFEQQRLLNIERNNVIMEGMGIPGLVPQELRAIRASSGTAARRRKRAAPPAEDDTRERRRSSRLANAPAVVFTTFEEDEDLGDSREKRSKRAIARPATADDGEVRTACACDSASRVCSRVQLACSSQTAALSVAASCRRLLLRLRAFPRRASLAALPQLAAARRCRLEWQTWRRGWASRCSRRTAPAATSWRPCRACVAEARCVLTSTPVSRSGRTRCVLCASREPRRTRLTQAAAQVALFVNVRGKSGSYANIFLQGGKQMTWFAQPTQDAETPVIRRLLACRDLTAATPVVLFIREEGCAYVYAGRLTCYEYFPRASPLKLVWTLADFEVRRR